MRPNLASMVWREAKTDVRDFTEPETTWVIARRIAERVVAACPKCPSKPRHMNSNPESLHYASEWRRAVGDEQLRWLRLLGVPVEPRVARVPGVDPRQLDLFGKVAP